MLSKWKDAFLNLKIGKLPPNPWHVPSYNMKDDMGFNSWTWLPLMKINLILLWC